MGLGAVIIVTELYIIKSCTQLSILDAIFKLSLCLIVSCAGVWGKHEGSQCLYMDKQTKEALKTAQNMPKSQLGATDGKQ